jgi:rod shape-determining protein MreC
VVIAVLLSMGLMVADQRQHLLEPLRSALSLLVAPLHYLADLPGGVVRVLEDFFAQESRLRHDNEVLRAETLVLQGRLQRFESLEAENRRLHDLLGSSFRVGERVLIAELLSVDLDPYRHQVLIDKGSASGVFVGQPVLDAKAVMGQVVWVGPTTSNVLLITDAAHGLPVRVNRNGLRAVARGTGLINQLDLTYVPHDADLEEGDLLVTSGLGGRFPAGYPVARVSEVKRESGQPFARVTATPMAHLDSGHEALLVWTLPKEGRATEPTAEGEGEKEEEPDKEKGGEGTCP